jgi:Galactose oxidase, central domain/Kelch motif
MLTVRLSHVPDCSPSCDVVADFVHGVATLNWRKVTVRKGRMPSARCWSALCAVKENLVLMGGYDINTPYPNDLHVFNTQTGAWRRMPFLPTEAPRYAHTLEYVNEKLLVFGGDSVNGYLNDVYIIASGRLCL